MFKKYFLVFFVKVVMMDFFEIFLFCGFVYVVGEEIMNLIVD